LGSFRFYEIELFDKLSQQFVLLDDQVFKQPKGQK
jgi:hypothetical protein